MASNPMCRAAAAALAIVAAFIVESAPARAQEGPGGLINPQRDCQTIVNCRFTKGGSYRGCVSSYSCRTCEFVPAKCSVGGRRGKVCEELRCGWGA